MLRMLFKLVVMKPQLCLSHLGNYADLMLEELKMALTTWRVLFILYALSMACLGLSVACGAAALLLWAALPELNPENSWLLVGLPVGLLVISYLLFNAAQRYKTASFFEGIQEQLRLDMLAICEVGET
jgi:predicted membrane metal-binding protein